MASFIDNLHWIPLLVISFIGFFLGGLWYSPLLFAKPWIKEMKFTEEDLKQKNDMPRLMGGAYLFTVVSTLTLDYLVTLHHSHSALSGAKMGLLVGVGLIASRQATNAQFERRTLKHFAIVAGHDVILCGLTGAILGVWR